jgi:hypothetical protein
MDVGVEPEESQLTEEKPMSDTPQALSPSRMVDGFSNPLTSHRIVLRANPDVQSTNMDGETVLLDLSTGRYYTLNRVGSVIWEQCTGTHTISDIQAVLCDRFDVAPERALDDLVTLVTQLTQEGLLQQERR